MPDSKYLVTGLLLVVLNLIATSPAVARDSNQYIGVGTSDSEYRQQDATKGTYNHYRALWGMSLSRHIILETNLTVGNNDTDTIYVSGTPVQLEIENMLNGMLRYHYPLQIEQGSTSRLNLVVMIGATRMQVIKDDGVSQVNGVEYRLAYGAGLEFYSGTKWALRADYMRYVDDTSATGIPFQYHSTGILLLMRLGN